MLKFELIQTYKHSIKTITTAEKLSDFYVAQIIYKLVGKYLWIEIFCKRSLRVVGFNLVLSSKPQPKT